MKTLKEIETALNEYKVIAENTYKAHPEIHSIDFGDIRNIPLKVMLKFAEKNDLKPEFQNWSKVILLNLYSFSNKFGKFQVTLKTVEVERTIPVAPPVLADNYKEVKSVKK